LKRLAVIPPREQRFERRRVDHRFAEREQPRERLVEQIGEQQIDVTRIQAALQRIFAVAVANVVETGAAQAGSAS
jgi:hypothetical protein